MKNLAKIFGIVVLMMVIGFSITSCKKDALDGTSWKSTFEGDDYILTFTSPNLTITLDGETVSGTYTVSGNAVNMTVDGETETGTLSGNTLSFEDGPVFTKTKK